MNVINVYEPLGASSAELTPAPRPVPRPHGANAFTLRKSGARPITFSGRLLGHHNGYRLGTPLWHELNLYQTEDGRFVADIRVFTKAQGGKDQFHVLVGESLEEALQFFEGYNPRADVPSDIPLEDDSLSPAELMVQAATLKVRVAETVSMYGAVLSTFLAEMHKQ
jgi:hypothetical protein